MWKKSMLNMKTIVNHIKNILLDVEKINVKYD